MSSTTTTINLSGIGSALNDIINVIVQYLPFIVTVGVVLGVIQFLFGGIGNAISGITGLFGGV